VDRDIAMPNFLTDFRIRNEPNARANEAFQESWLRCPLRFQSRGIWRGTELLDSGTKPRMGQAAVGTRVPNEHYVK
jgi:hypothetical protein